MDATESAEKSTPKKRSGRTAGIIATALWMIGFILTVAVPAGSPFVFLGDALLLIGFWPLLWLWSPGWPWIVFGLLNIGIGFFLEIAYVLPDALFWQNPVPGADVHAVLAVRNHLRDQHSAITWIIVGFISTVYGLIRTGRQIFAWIANKKANPSRTVTGA
jgi:hypothetical protein